MATKKTDNAQDTKRVWTKPKINSNVPVNRTQGGSFVGGSGEDGFYQS